MTDFTAPIELDQEDKDVVSIPPATQVPTIEDRRTLPLELDFSDFPPLEPRVDLLDPSVRQGAENIAIGAADIPMAITSQLFIKPFLHYDAAGKAIFNKLAGNTEERTKDLADNFLSEQSKMAARKGAMYFFNYEPVTDAGSTTMNFTNKVLGYIGAVTEFIGEHGALAMGGAVDNVFDGVRKAGELKPGGWTAEDEYRLQGVKVPVKASLQTLIRAAPDAALLGTTLLSRIGRRSREAELQRTADQLHKGLQKETIPFVNLRQLENFDPKPLAPVEIESLRAQIDKGQFSTDISLETIGGKPIRILTGADTVRSLQLMEQTQGVRVTNVKVRMVEKTQYSAKELAQLELLGKSGFADIIANEARLEAAGKAQSLTFKEKLVRYGLDASGNLKAKLLEEAGEKGQQAVQMLTLAAGGTPRASMLFSDIQRNVWFKKGKDDPGLDYGKKFSPQWNPDVKYSERELFDYFAHANRALEIAKTKPGRVKTTEKVVDGQVVTESKFIGYKLDGPITPGNAPGILHEVKRLVGDKRYAQFEERLSHLYDGMRIELDRMRDAGLIDDAAHKKMQGLNYLTRRFSATLDNVNVNDPRRITVGDSGIPYLRHGTKDRAFITNVEPVVAEHIARAERRIARNDATRALAEVAKSGTVDWVRPFEGKKIPVGYKEIKYFENGTQKSLLMTDKMAAEWTYGDLGINYALSEIFRVGSGSSVVKALATGYNPEFAIRNFTRDIQHAWRSTGTQFSSFAPVYLGQLAVNISHVWKDALFKTGAYRDYVMDGGGFETLTHQGRNLLRGPNETSAIVSEMGYRGTKFAEKFEKVKEALALVGETSELVTRLAIRDRVLMNQRTAGLPLDPQAATYVARNYLDFSQGGSAIKVVDTLVPYLNANVQALRTGLRPYTQGGKSAAVTAFKDFQLIGTKAALQSYAWQSDPETMRMVSDDTLISNFVVPLGMHIVDDDGVVKPLVLKFPLDSSVIPFTGPMDLLIKKANTGDDPSQSLLTLLQAANPIGATPTIPTVQALIGYATNYNFYTNDKIWKGEDVDPGVEYTDQTPEFYKLLGQVAPNTVSPERLRYMVRTMAPSNTYFYGAEFVSNLMLEEQDPAAAQRALDNEKYQMTEEMLTRGIGLRRLVSIVEPAEAMSQIQKQVLRQTNTEMKMLDDEFNSVVKSVTTFGMSDPRAQKPYSELVKKVANHYADRPDILDMVTKTYTTKIATDVAWNRVVGKRELYFPVKETWIHLASMQPEDRAKVFYQIWRTKATDEERNKMFKIAGIMDEVAGKGTILSERFMVAFSKRQAKFGDDKPLVLDGE